MDPKYTQTLNELSHLLLLLSNLKPMKKLELHFMKAEDTIIPKYNEFFFNNASCVNLLAGFNLVYN